MGLQLHMIDFNLFKIPAFINRLFLIYSKKILHYFPLVRNNKKYLEII